MPPPNNKQQPGTHEPNWVDKWTLYVLAATLIVVVIYTCEAHRQNTLAQRSLELNSRPYLMATFGECKTPQIGQKFHCEAFIENSGKIPAEADIRSVTFYSPLKIPAPSFFGYQERQLVWPTRRIASLMETPGIITEGQLSDMKAGRGFLYMRILVRYGSYHTEICTGFSLVPSSSPDNRLMYADPFWCDEEGTNSVN